MFMLIRNGALAVALVTGALAPTLSRADHTQPSWGQFVNISCSSTYSTSAHCAVQGWVQGAQLYQQFGQAPCHYGYNWGWDQNGVWVSNGCAGYFQVQIQGYQPPPPPPPQEFALPTVTVGSKGQSYYCPSSYNGYPFSRAEIANYHGAQQSYNGCYIPDKKASCDITCFYRQW